MKATISQCGFNNHVAEPGDTKTKLNVIVMSYGNTSFGFSEQEIIFCSS